MQHPVLAVKRAERQKEQKDPVLAVKRLRTPTHSVTLLRTSPEHFSDHPQPSAWRTLQRTTGLDVQRAVLRANSLCVLARGGDGAATSGTTASGRGAPLSATILWSRGWTAVC